MIGPRLFASLTLVGGERRLKLRYERFGDERFDAGRGGGAWRTWLRRRGVPRVDRVHDLDHESGDVLRNPGAALGCGEFLDRLLHVVQLRQASDFAMT